MSEKYIPKYLLSDILDYVKLTPTVKKFQTNGNMASYLQDINGYVQNLDKTTLTSIKPYKLGTLNNINNIELFVDPYMLWSDNKIIFFVFT